jgi:hypothetical protein
VSLVPVGCTTYAAAVPESAAAGTLVVYSATYASTLEESEYPAHTDYTVATPSDTVLERVSNRTGSFDKRPAPVNLPPGEYHVRAQYNRGGFVTIPVVIETGKITTLSLDGSPMPTDDSPAPVPLYGPGGVVVGWGVTRRE